MKDKEWNSLKEFVLKYFDYHVTHYQRTWIENTHNEKVLLLSPRWHGKGKPSINKYPLSIEELNELGHCVLADSISKGDNYDVDDTIIKWLTQYKQHNPYFKTVSVFGEEIKAMKQRIWRKMHDDIINDRIKFPEPYRFMRNYFELKECNHDNNVKITSTIASSIHLQSTGKILDHPITSKDIYWYYCIKCHIVYHAYPW